MSLTGWMVDIFARLPLANFAVPSPNAWEVALLYGLLLGSFALRKRIHLGALLAVALIAISERAAPIGGASASSAKNCASPISTSARGCGGG